LKSEDCERRGNKPGRMRNCVKKKPRNVKRKTEGIYMYFNKTRVFPRVVPQRFGNMANIIRWAST
jgi:hypothetical protein